MKSCLASSLLMAGLLACGHPNPASSASPQGLAPESTARSPEDSRLELWEDLLRKHAVGGGLRYSGLAVDRALLEQYLAGVAEARIDTWSREQELAFRINAYNALVAEGMVRRYPDLISVIDIEGFFDAEKHTVAGEELTLNELERKALDLGEPRVHFAVVCASAGCPDLLGEAYDAERLEAQLAAQTSAFLADSTKGLRFDADSGTLWLSSIFDWYAKDFGGDAVAWILQHLPEDRAQEIRDAKPQVKFLDYDWAPNDRE
ncbi:MAG: DUF547 domain-containing protein [Acidobacteria bacterium]|nr:DUF547 domain-containing protein [Acidobacteriota bacterium]